MLRSAGVNYSNKSIQYYFLLLDEYSNEDRLLRISTAYFTELKHLIYISAQSIPMQQDDRKKYFSNIDKSIDSLNMLFMHSFDAFSEELKQAEKRKMEESLVNKLQKDKFSSLVFDPKTSAPVVHKSFVDVINSVKSIINNSSKDNEGTES